MDQVLEEIQLLITTYKTDYIFFMDPIFTCDKKRVLAICKQIKSLKLKFRWGCEGHVNFIDEEMIDEMELSGCHDIAFGIESGVQSLLDNVHKGTCLADIEKGLRLIKKKTRIKISGLFILGLPGESYAHSLQTIAFSKKLPLDMAQFSIFVPYPGSQLFSELARKGEIDTGFRPDGTLDTDVWQRYSSYISFTSNEPIWVTPGLTAPILRRLQKKAIREFYFRPYQFLFQLQRLSFNEISKAFSGLVAVMEDKI
ncbi:MAG: radical SAM protein [Candidatus Omnitrophota bacterium]